MERITMVKGNKKFLGLSLFSSAGVAELNLSPYIDFKLANELLPIRCKVHKFWYPDVEILEGDITSDKIKKTIIEKSIQEKIDFILATPPCQGVSLIGKNKRNDQFLKDARNFFIFHAFDIIDAIHPHAVVIENVDRFTKMLFPYKNSKKTIMQILNDKYKDQYNIDINIYNAADYGVPQNRRRMIAVLYDKTCAFTRPSIEEHKITVREAIGSLPSLESGETSNLKHHNARIHTPANIEAMKHTPTGLSAFQNTFFYPKKNDGSKITGYPYTYKRIDWDRPAPTITMRSDIISSTHSVHPGRPLGNGEYSDARVLTLRELFILSSINPDIDVPDFASDGQIRCIVGEAVPPVLMEKVCRGLKRF